VIASLALPQQCNKNLFSPCVNVHVCKGQKGEHQRMLHIHLDLFLKRVFFLPFQDEEEEIKLEINVLRKVCCRPCPDMC